ncbi:MAG: TRAP transporter small permease subunit [Burkholderiales bacterium]|nr:TRAP transporter small permease subunit [Burkholderiales bacterium]
MNTLLRIVDRLDRASGRLIAAARWLALPLAMLLFLQWPLRDLVHAYSRQANDLAQCLFALYVSMSVTDATRRGSHLAPRPLASRWAQRWHKALHAAGLLLALLPWSAFVLVSSGAQVWQSLLQREAFPESFNPGYFVVKLSLWLLAGAVFVQALIDLARLCRRGE